MENLRKIGRAKEDGISIDILQTQVAFSKLGMVTLGVTESTGDARFERGSMVRDKKLLGDQMEWAQPFKDGKTHGVFVICAKGTFLFDSEVIHCHCLLRRIGKDTCTKGKDDIIKLFGASIEVRLTDILSGNVRPGDDAGKEHFGWQDSLSQPALRYVSPSIYRQLC